MNQPTETAGAATANQAQQDTATAPAKRAAKRKTPATGDKMTDGGKPLVGVGSNVPPALVKAGEQVAKRLETLESQHEADVAEKRRLQALLKEAQRVAKGAIDGERKLPVSDAQLRKAIDAMTQATRADASKPVRSLKSQFVIRKDGDKDVAEFIGDTTATDTDEHVTPELTDGQRKLWKAGRKEIDALHTRWVRQEAPKLVQGVKRLIKDPTAIANGGSRKNKAGKLVAARIGVRLPPAPKVTAKPQVQP